ncbi:DNA cytosine methyltransferase [Vibrio sp. D431a]|uniref:DNA cytosine methyltransferase n=1 Tax=Vibrio sp. D431a TaxID=2837388 RepID=UPI002556BC59|nr:DNA cytosine methyltransferase [Vibrio sp. D431a]MDK9789910.1 DNA cytosine methyltransferase [Vibrio sp. D431a]
MKTTTVVDHDVSAKNTARGKRVWFRSDLLGSRCGVKFGDKFRVIHQKNRIRMVKDPEGTLSVTMSRGKLSFDLHNKKVAESFSDNVLRVFIEVSLHEVVICLRRTDERIQARIAAFKERMEKKEKLLLGDLCSGIGGLAYSIVSGFNKVGQGIRCAFAVDHHHETMEASAFSNPVYDDTTTIMSCSLEQAPLDLMPQLDILITGLSCKGASKQARTGKTVSLPEFHEEAGWLVMTLPTIIQKTNPLVFILENVLEWFDTASCHILKELMTRLGYTHKEVTLKGNDFGAIEGRVRGSLVFTTVGIDIDLELPVPVPCVTTVADIMEPQENLPPIPSSFEEKDFKGSGWYPKARLLEREEEKKAAGKGHRAKIAKPNDTRITTITASYGKGVRLDETVVESSCGQWLRLLTKVEHARAKSLPIELTENLAKTNAHKALGNSVEKNCFEWLGVRAAMSVNEFFTNLPHEEQFEATIVSLSLKESNASALRSKQGLKTYYIIVEMSDGMIFRHKKQCPEEKLPEAKRFMKKIQEAGVINNEYWVELAA